MKIKLTLLITAAVLLFSCAAPGSLNLPKDANGNYEYQGIITVDDKTKDELHESAKEWIVLNFRSANDVIQLDDQENGQLIAKGYYGIMMMGMERQIYHTLRLESRDGRFRYTVNDFEYYTPGQQRMSLERTTLSQQQGEKIDERVKNTIASLQKALNTESEDW